MRKDPVIIGGVGGSGTRVFSKITRGLGIYMGSDFGKAGDAVAFQNFHRTWITPALTKKYQLSESEETAVKRCFFDCASRVLSEIPTPDSPWGYKHPGSLLMLPVLHKMLPLMKFIHVIRNGLDMAYSKNKTQLGRFGHLVLDRNERRQSLPAQTISYWAKANLRASEYGEKFLKERYLCIRFEELCDEPVRVIGKIGDFLGMQKTDEAKLSQAVSEVITPDSVGRWRYQQVKEIHTVLKAGRAGLERFGYWDPVMWNKIENALQKPFWERWFFRFRSIHHLSVC